MLFRSLIQQSSSSFLSSSCEAKPSQVNRRRAETVTLHSYLDSNDDGDDDGNNKRLICIKITRKSVNHYQITYSFLLARSQKLRRKKGEGFILEI